MKTIQISRGLTSLVSDVDYVFISSHKWYLSGEYARHNKLGQMHRVILERKLKSSIPYGIEVDHINRIKIDNRRCNLRLATRSQNQSNCDTKIGKHGLRGIATHRRKWRAQIQKDTKKIFIGLYTTKEEAALAYNIKAKELFGKFAYQNKL